jgi:hypothetical protein
VRLAPFYAFGIYVSVTTIYKVLKEKYQLRSKWQKNQKRGPVPSAKAPREVILMDTVDFGGVFAFTAIDIFTRESDVLLRPSLEATDGQAFLHHSMIWRFNGFSETIQTDGGKEFKKEFETDVSRYCNLRRVARLTKKMNRVSLRASIVACEKSAWDGLNIRNQKSQD